MFDSWNPLPAKQSFPDLCVFVYTYKHKVYICFYGIWVVRMYEAVFSVLLYGDRLAS
jgi:hypothetical protein